MRSIKKNHYTCDICNKSFLKNSLLHRHYLIHGQIYHFSCDLCSKQFKQKSILKTHIERIHLRKKTEVKSVVKKDQVHEPKEITIKDTIIDLKNLQLCLNINPEHEAAQPVEDYKTISINVNGKDCDLKFERKVIEKIVHLICYFCSKPFRKPSDLERHVRVHLCSRPFACQIEGCCKMFSLKSTLKKHLLIHNKEFHKCNQCSRNYKSLKLLEKHQLGHDTTAIQSQRKHDINKDCQSFLRINETKTTSQNFPNDPNDNPAQLIKINEYTQDNEFQGSIITNEVHNNDFHHIGNEEIVETSVAVQEIDKTSEALQEVVDNTQNANVCDVCSKTFKKSNDLTRHLRIHNNERPFECEICYKKFTLKCTLDRHVETHSDQRNMVTCHICNLKLVSKNGLHLHLKIHSGTKDLPCLYKECPMFFRTPGNLNAHMKVHQKEAKKLGVDPKRKFNFFVLCYCHLN